MTQVSAGIYEDAQGNLTDINGKILVPVEKRTRDLVYSRPVGYLSPVENWNPGKRAEWNERVNYQVKIESGEVKEGGDA
jgi:hypothetical protein